MSVPVDAAAEMPAKESNETKYAVWGSIAALIVVFPLAAFGFVTGRFLLPRFRAPAWWSLLACAALSLLALIFWGIPDPVAWFAEAKASLFPRKGDRDILGAFLAPGLWPLVLGLLVGSGWRVFRDAQENPPWQIFKERKARKHIASVFLKNGYVTLGLSQEDRASRVVLPDETTNTGALVLGATGAGKTRGVISMLADVVASGSACVYIDLKGSSDVPMMMAGLAAQHSRPFWHFKLFDASREPYVGPAPGGPASYNPAAHGDPTRRKDLLMAALASDNQYYANIAGAYALTAFTVLQQAGRLDGHSALNSILSVMDPADLLRAARSIDMDNPMRSRLIADAEEEVRKATKDRDYRTNLRGLRDYLSLIMDSVAGPFINESAEDVIDFAEVDRLGGVVVFSLSDMEYANLPAQLGSLIIQDFSTYAGIRERATERNPFYLVVDEFSAFGRDNILSLLARGRSAGVHTILATQNLADLHRAGEGFRDQVLGIVGSFVLFRGNTQMDCELMSGLTGREGSEGFIDWPELQSLGVGECVLINNMPLPADPPRGCRVGRRERVEVVLREIPSVAQVTVNMQVGEDDSGNWLASVPVDERVESILAEMKGGPAGGFPPVDDSLDEVDEFWDEVPAAVGGEPVDSPVDVYDGGGRPDVVEVSVPPATAPENRDNADNSDNSPGFKGLGLGTLGAVEGSGIEQEFEEDGSTPSEAPERLSEASDPHSGATPPENPEKPSTAVTEPLVVCSEAAEPVVLRGKDDRHLSAAPPPRRAARKTDTD